MHSVRAMLENTALCAARLCLLVFALPDYCTHYSYGSCTVSLITAPLDVVTGRGGRGRISSVGKKNKKSPGVFFIYREGGCGTRSHNFLVSSVKKSVSSQYLKK